jgi:hypothetical protein
MLCHVLFQERTTWTLRFFCFDAREAGGWAEGFLVSYHHHHAVRAVWVYRMFLEELNVVYSFQTSSGCCVYPSIHRYQSRTWGWVEIQAGPWIEVSDVSTGEGVAD